MTPSTIFNDLPIWLQTFILCEFLIVNACVLILGIVVVASLSNRK